MKPILLIAAAVTLLAFTGRAFATCETTYDYTTGNSYQSCENTDSRSVVVKDHLHLAGSYLETTYTPGNAHTGYDSNNNQDAGGYFDYRTGMYCAGTEDNIVCTGG